MLDKVGGGRSGGGIILPPPLQNKPLKSRPRLELKTIKATSFKIFKTYLILNTPKEIFNRNISFHNRIFHLHSSKKKVTYKAVFRVGHDDQNIIITKYSERRPEAHSESTKAS